MAKKKNESRGDRNIRWIEKHCRVPEGPHLGKPVVLRPFQREWIRLIYDNPHTTRLAILSVGRKNAKTTFAAFLLLLHLCGPEMNHNAQLFSAAQSKEQAAVIFALAAKIVRLSSTLRPVVVIRDSGRQLYCPDLGTLYRALSADVATNFGLSPVFIVHDELGQVKGPKSALYEALETATSAQEKPLSIIISTQAPTDEDLMSQLVDDAVGKNDPRVVCSLFTAPTNADPFAEKTIRAANPAFGDFQNSEEVMSMAEAARRMPSREADYRNLVLNQRVEQSNPFITKSVWQTCGDEPTAAFDKLPAYGGLDLSETKDLTCLVRVALAHDRWHVRSTFWLPSDGLRERSRLDRVPYDVWKAEGHLQTTPGKSVDYDFVAFYLREIFNATALQKVAFDMWNFRHLKPCLLRAGFTEQEIEAKFVQFGQGYKSMSPALRNVEAIILSGKMNHGNDPVLSMCARNAVVTRDPAGNRKLDKAKARGRIDGMVALTMATSIAVEQTEDRPPEYQMFFV